MPRDGSGVYSKPAGTTAVSGTTIESSKYNSQVDDMVADLNAARPITAGGTGATTAAAARTNLGLTTGTAGYIFGLRLSNNVSDATNDIDIAAGVAAETATSPALMSLATALTKRLDAAWVVGTNQGGIDTGSVADGTYHMWLIQRSDTGVVDVLFSLSATAPTMPTNYDRKRRIGSVLRSAGTILGFTHVGRNMFVLNSTFTMRSSTAALATSLLAFATPGGIQTEPLITISVGINANSTGITNFGSAAVGTTTTTVHTLSGSSATTVSSYTPGGFLTNTAQQIYANVTISVGTLTSHVIGCAGWIDTFL